MENDTQNTIQPSDEGTDQVVSSTGSSSELDTRATEEDSAPSEAPNLQDLLAKTTEALAQTQQVLRETQSNNEKLLDRIKEQEKKLDQLEEKTCPKPIIGENVGGYDYDTRERVFASDEMKDDRERARRYLKQIRNKYIQL